MPRIPTVTQLPRVVPTGSAPVATVNTQGIGAPFAELAGAAAAEAERRTAYQVSKAEADFLTAKVKEENAYDNDPEFGTIVDRYQTNVSKTLGEVSSKIQLPSARAAFVEKHQVSIAAGTERMRDIARAKERDHERGQVNDSLANVRESGINGDPVAAAQTAKDLLENAASLGYYSEEEKSKMYAAFRDDMVVGKLKTMPSEQRVNALKEPWAKNLPSDVHAELLRKAEEETLAGKAIAKVDKYLADNLTREQAIVETSKIKDAKLREETERRFDYAFAKQEQAKLENQSSIFEKHFLDVRSGAKTVDSIPDAEMRALTPEQQSSLFSAQAAAVTPTARTPYNIIDTLQFYNASQDYVGLRKYLLDNAGNMSPSDFATWSKISMQGVVPIEVKSFLTDSQLINNKLDGLELGKNDIAKAQLTEKLSDWYTEYQETFNKLPNDKEREAKIDSLLIQYDTSWLWGGNKYRFAMDAKDESDALDRLRSSNPEVFQDVVKGFKDIGYQYSFDDFVNMYRVLEAKRNAAK